MRQVRETKLDVKAWRLGFTCQADIYDEDTLILSVINMFTIRGARREAEWCIGRLEEGTTVTQLVMENSDARLGW